MLYDKDKVLGKLQSFAITINCRAVGKKAEFFNLVKNLGFLCFKI